MASTARYKCACGRYSGLSELFYCSTSCELLCQHPDCVQEEIDSYYCPHTLENVPSSEALLNRMRSLKCFECPGCLNTLSICWGAAEAAFYLECNYCRWNSLAIAVQAANPEALSAAVQATEQEVPGSDLVARLVEGYRGHQQQTVRRDELLQRIDGDRTHGALTPSVLSKLKLDLAALTLGALGGEGGGVRPVDQAWTWADFNAMIAEKEKEAAVGMGGGAGVAGGGGVEEKKQAIEGGVLDGGAAAVVVQDAGDGDGDGSGSAGAGASAGESESESGSGEAKERGGGAGVRAGAVEDAAAVRGATLAETTLLEQRLLHPGVQPSLACNLQPLRKPLATKRSLRSRKTRKILLKPQINPLTGDSSLRNNVGAWFKKSTVATTFLPHVSARWQENRALRLHRIEGGAEGRSSSSSGVSGVSGVSGDSGSGESSAAGDSRSSIESMGARSRRREAWPMYLVFTNPLDAKVRVSVRCLAAEDMRGGDTKEQEQEGDADKGGVIRRVGVDEVAAAENDVLLLDTPAWMSGGSSTSVVASSSSPSSASPLHRASARGFEAAFTMGAHDELSEQGALWMDDEDEEGDDGDEPDSPMVVARRGNKVILAVNKVLCEQLGSAGASPSSASPTSSSSASSSFALGDRLQLFLEMTVTSSEYIDATPTVRASAGAGAGGRAGAQTGRLKLSPGGKNIVLPGTPGSHIGAKKAVGTGAGAGGIATPTKEDGVNEVKEGGEGGSDPTTGTVVCRVELRLQLDA